MDNKSLISVQQLNVHIGNQHILKDINIDIPDKKVTSIIGPSGCGKTTLLKTFNRLLDNSADVKITGKVLVDGENIYDPDVEVTHIRQKMGLLSQRPYPLPMSIYDNVAYGPRIHGIRKKHDLDELVEKQLKATGLWEEVKDRLHASATRLSIGQQQRLCLARGLAVGPEIILGDESTSALDPVSTHIIEDLFVQLKEKYTIVLVTHILRQAARISDHIIFVYMGKIIEAGPTNEILQNPKEELTKQYVKGFIT
ncbi:phosphate ABC transporter ATP-binding protein [Mucilaginibacter gotjawali]|jgi:phosphate transport system ATP-binding protein|uniref:Phosphate transport system ATP-binding protein n=2 Tax=Mucilaginibacter gotjawali TaxID=1550579 RepID=A0A839SGX0_9SPHI|nr:phosphate ABC transporter ATP-binding protein [Mucilaginibacter gotjawali]MBB3055777.1 phosphate transport system ATP-binding protein [Mucilaginibacter gotjawali]BAU54598.1 Phosphate import ATP-binding protein PstB 3 [Mucilaginibacter gotjawali]